MRARRDQEGDLTVRRPNVLNEGRLLTIQNAATPPCSMAIRTTRTCATDSASTPSHPDSRRSLNHSHDRCIRAQIHCQEVCQLTGRKSVRTFVSAIYALTAFSGVWGINSYAQSPIPFYTKAEFARAVAVQSVNQPALLATEGVFGVGVGATNGSLAIAILVDSTNRAAQLPSTLNDLPVSVRAVGAIRAASCGGSNPQITYPLPVPLGVSGGNVLQAGDPSSCASGTIGFKVRDNTTGLIGWISNNHVVGHGTDGCPNTAPIGTPQYQPGPIDASPVCSSAQFIGTLNRVVPLVFGGANNEVDAAFVLSSDLAVSSDILNLGAQVNNVVPAFVGQVVRKNGRTSSCTEGIVTAINVTILVTYGSGCSTAIFTNQIMYSPTAPSTTMSEHGDSGSPVVDANNNAVALNFALALDGSGNGYGNPMAAVLSALNVTLSSLASSQVVTRTSRFWFTHGFSSETNCATLLKAMTFGGGILDLGFVQLPTANRNFDNVVDGTDAFIEALGFYWRGTGRTGENGGSQSAKVKASGLCTARKQLAVELIAATANSGLLGTWPGNATYVNGGTVTNFPADLIPQARAAAAGFDVGTIRSMTALLKLFNRSGLTNDLPNGLVECSPQPSKTLKPISRDPMTRATCPGVNNSCDSAEVVAFPTSANPFAPAVFTRGLSLNTYTNNMPSPACGAGGRDAVWKILPDVGTATRSFTVTTAQSNFDTMLSVWRGTCSNLVAVSCVDAFHDVRGESLSFQTDGIDTFFIVVEGPTGNIGKTKVTVTSP